jgi:hypothetical protein
MIYTGAGLDIEELKELCKGKIQWRKCQDCDTEGRQYWDGRYDEGSQPGPSGIPKEHLESDNCNTCDGLGYILFRV